MGSRARQVTALFGAVALAVAFPACGGDSDAEQLEKEAREGSDQIKREAEELREAVTEGDREAVEKQQKKLEKEARKLQRRLEDGSPAE